MAEKKLDVGLTVEAEKDKKQSPMEELLDGQKEMMKAITEIMNILVDKQKKEKAGKF
jgi:hypothetical protein